MARRMKKPRTAEEVRRNAERTYKHFAPENILHRVGISKPTYFYHYGITESGKAEVMGPERQEEAERYAAELDEGEVYELDTMQLAKATRIIKAELIKRGVAHDKALERIKHTRLKEL